jgi:hypothetical protein
MDKEQAHRDAQRGGDNFRWFTPDEAAVAEALGRIIVPSDGETPGAEGAIRTVGDASRLVSGAAFDEASIIQTVNRTRLLPIN